LKFWLAFNKISFSALPSSRLPRRGARTNPPYENNRSTEADDVSGVLDLSETFKIVGYFLKFVSDVFASFKKVLISKLRSMLLAVCSGESVIRE